MISTIPYRGIRGSYNSGYLPNGESVTFLVNHGIVICFREHTTWPTYFKLRINGSSFSVIEGSIPSTITVAANSDSTITITNNRGITVGIIILNCNWNNKII